MPSSKELGTWKVFLDLQCPYSRICWRNLPSIIEKHDDAFTFSRHITSLAFHPQAFDAQCAAVLVGGAKGVYTRRRYEDALFEHQERFMNDALGDCTKSDVAAVLADIAEGAGVFDDGDDDDGDGFTRDVFLSKLHDWEAAVKPAHEEHKEALRYGVYGTPKHVINEKLIADTESSWGGEEWSSKLLKEGLVD